MSNFEAVLLVSPEMSQKALLKELEDFKKQVENNKGKVINIEDWGLRDLSYKITTFKNAFYNFYQKAPLSHLNKNQHQFQNPKSHPPQGYYSF